MLKLPFTETSRRWQELWSTCSITPLSPREMHAWLNGFDKLRYLVEETYKTVKEVEIRQSKRSELRAILVTELAAAGEQGEIPGEDLASPLQFAEDFLQKLQDEQSRRKTMEARVGDLENALESALKDQRDAKEDLNQWESLWNEAVTPLGIGSKALPTEAIDFMETLQGCFEKLREADDFRKRIDGIDRDARGFEVAVLELVKQIAPEIQEFDAPQAVTHLKTILGRASQDHALVEQYIEEIESLKTAILEAKAELSGTTEQIAALRQLAGCETEEQLNLAELRSTELLRLKEKLEAVEEALSQIAEGVPIDELETQAQEIDPDDLPGRIEGLRNEIDVKIDPEIRDLSETIGREKLEIVRMDGSGKAAELADASQQELAKIRRLTERYIRVKLAYKILREEIERYRAENQDPVLKIASRYINDLTLGSIGNLRTDIDDQGQPVLIGVRPNGSWVRVDGMSSGTRDQLYLALRLATLEWRVQSNEPMPFIVDDILINFDDERSKATLKALANLAEKTQVILFTHHSQIIETAKDIDSSVRVTIHML